MKPDFESEEPENCGTFSGPQKIIQPHGGALYTGGVPGNKGGRPSNKIREMCREGMLDAAPGIIEIAKHSETDGDKIRAFDVLGKYGLGEAKVMVEDDVLDKVMKVLESKTELTPEQQEDIFKSVVEKLKEG